jgi:hypothetical protein
VAEFYEIAEKMERIIEELVNVEGFLCRDFDAVNLVGLAGILSDLERITYDEIYLEDLIVDTYDEMGKPILVSLKDSRVVKALNGKSAENNMRKQVNYYTAEEVRRQTNAERLEYNLKKVQEEGYPVNNELILLFNESNRIYDGQHRASCLYYLYGNIKVKVRRLWFKEGRYSDTEKSGFVQEQQYALEGEQQLKISSAKRIQNVYINIAGNDLENCKYKVIVKKE